MAKWFKDRYDSVNSEKTIASYMSSIFQNLGLVQFAEKKYKLTPSAVSFLENPSKDAAFEILNERIFGIEETLSFVENSENPVTDSDIRSYLIDNFNVDWSTNAQASFRLLWLWNLGKIQRNEDGRYFC